MDYRSLLARLPVSRLQNPPPVAAVVRLSGPIGSVGRLRGGLTLASLDSAIERAFRLPRLCCVALAINSPGGSPVQSDLIARRIRDLAEEKNVPVLAFCEDVAASGGYWLACAADQIYVRESSVVGSIGVIAAGFGFPDLLKRIGVERRVYTVGEQKGMLDPFQSEKPDEVAHLKQVQQDIQDHFTAYVRKRRQGRLAAPEDELFTGSFWSGRRALDLGLVDGVGEMRQVLRNRFGEKVVVRRMESGKAWWRKRFGMAAGHSTDGDGVRSGGRGMDDAVTGVLAAIEERALWSRFGL